MDRQSLLITEQHPWYCVIIIGRKEYFILWQYCHLIYNADIKTLAKSFVSKVKYR